MIYCVNNSSLYYEPNYGIINDYCQYIINLLKQLIMCHPNINITFCNNDYNFNNSNKTIKIGINVEHTIVKQYGRDSVGHPTGNIMDENGSNYLVRIVNYQNLIDSNIIIDYSIPNITNVYTSRLFDSFANKHIYISACIYYNELHFIKENRNIQVLTTFINTHEPRRHQLIINIKNKNIPHINVNNCFEKTPLQNLYKQTKVLINIHQTTHHDTFEELRVLSAIQCGVLVVCEKSPLSELIPYNSYIIWASYDDILDKVNDVLSNYDYYFNKIFNNNNSEIIACLNDTNYKTLNNKLTNYLNN